jgi:hypothetical protein
VHQPVTATIKQWAAPASYSSTRSANAVDGWRQHSDSPMCQLVDTVGRYRFSTLVC